MNTGKALAWRYALTLAHEVGHALDFNRIHPLQVHLSGRRTRYRSELAAVAHTHLIVAEFHLADLRTTQRYLERERAYLMRYAPGKNPSLDELLAQAVL